MNKQVFVPSSTGETDFNSGKHRVGQGIQSILSQEEGDISEIFKTLEASKGVPEQEESFDPFNKN